MKEEAIKSPLKGLFAFITIIWMEWVEQRCAEDLGLLGMERAQEVSLWKFLNV